MLFAFLFDKRATAHDEITTLRITFGDDALPTLADETFGILNAEDVDLAKGQEPSELSDLTFESAVIGGDDDGFDDRALRKAEPVADFSGGEGQRDVVNAFCGVEFRDDNFDLQTGFQDEIVRELFEGRESKFARAEVDKDGISGDGRDAP